MIPASAARECQLSEFHEMPGHLIRRLHQISTSLFSEEMERCGYDLTPIQFAALASIEEKPGLDQASLAGSIACDRVTTGGVVDRLEHKKLINRKVSEQDRRARNLYITEDGTRFLKKVRPVVRDLQNNILVGLDASEKEQLLKLLTKVAREGNLLSRAPLLDSRKSEVQDA